MAEQPWAPICRRHPPNRTVPSSCAAIVPCPFRHFRLVRHSKQADFWLFFAALRVAGGLGFEPRLAESEVRCPTVRRSPNSSLGNHGRIGLSDAGLPEVRCPKWVRGHTSRPIFGQPSSRHLLLWSLRIGHCSVSQDLHMVTPISAHQDRRQDQELPQVPGFSELRGWRHRPPAGSVRSCSSMHRWPGIRRRWRFPQTGPAAPWEYPAANGRKN